MVYELAFVSNPGTQTQEYYSCITWPPNNHNCHEQLWILTCTLRGQTVGNHACKKWIIRHDMLTHSAPLV